MKKRVKKLKKVKKRRKKFKFKLIQSTFYFHFSEDVMRTFN